MAINAFDFAMNTVGESKMSVSSTLSSQSQAELIYISDASDQQWSPNTITENHRLNPVQWPNVHYESNNIARDSAQMYNVQKPNQGENQSYLNPQYNLHQPSKEYADLTYQKRHNFNSNGHYIQNGPNAPHVVFNNINGINTRNDAEYIHTQSSIVSKSSGSPNSINLNNTYNGFPTNRNHVPRANWNSHKASPNGVKKPKRVRTAFTTQQMMELELEYARTRYLDRNRRIELSETLHLSEKTIKVWFQNRRMKDKKDRAECIEDLEATSTTESSPELNMPPPPPYNNIHQTVPYNGVSYQGNNRHMERYQLPLPTLDTSAIPVPVHNAVVNAYPHFFTQPHHLPMSLTPNMNQQNQLEPVHHFHREAVVNDEIAHVSPETNQVDENSTTEYNNRDEVNNEELSPENDLNERITPITGTSEDNWELSWVRIMDMNGEV